MSLQTIPVAGESGVINTELATAPKATASGQLLLLCHGLPLSRGGGRIASQLLPDLAERVSAESGWTVAVASLRGVGLSPGTFSASGWRKDLATVIAELTPGHTGVVLAGFGLGGALALRMAVDDEDVRGVATFATPADLGAWCGPAEQFAASCQRAGVVDKEPLMAPNQLVADVLALDPLGAAALIPPRRMMIVHGSDDPIVPLSAARQLVDAAEGHAELRIIQGAGHWLRADPRMVATLMGWLDRLR